MFKVPEEHRVTRGPMQSHPQHGNNGMFIFLSPLDVTNQTKFVCIASDGLGWDHVSVQVTEQGKQEGRCPTWHEMCIVKDMFWAEEACVVQYHPARNEYVNCHPHVLHLWCPQEQELPKPPSFMVGPKDSEKGDIEGFIQNIAERLAEEVRAKNPGIEVVVVNGNDRTQFEPFKLETVQEMWGIFADGVVPPDAGPDQIRDMRSCFYAGVTNLMAKLHQIGEPEVPDDVAENYLQALDAELHAFKDQLIKRVMEENGPEETH